MKFGIKYCGGCNPKYDRVLIASRFKADIGCGNSVEAVKEGTIYDIVVVLCGCCCACANTENIKVIYQKVYVTSESDYEKLLVVIDKIKFSG
jgi:hypothetical protein